MSTSPPGRSSQTRQQPPRRRRGKVSSKGLALLALLTFLVNGVFVWAAWSLIQGREPIENEPSSVPFVDPLNLPEPLVTPEPTFIPTQVVLATSTPSQAGRAGLSLSEITGGLIPPTATPTTIPALPPPVRGPFAPPPPTTPAQPGIEHVIIISIDGLRPDALFAAEAPTLDGLIARGAYCPVAQTVQNSTTLPSHASMLTGMIPEKHGLLWSAPYIGWPGLAGPTVFNVAHDAGLSTTMVFGKQKLNYMNILNSVDRILGADTHDSEVKAWAVEVIQGGLPNLLFIHFPDVDRVGHSSGWMSENQLQAVQFVDGLIGEIVAALEAGGYLDSTLIIVTADHGGHAFGHGDDSPEDRTIPWLAAGPGAPPGLTLTRRVNTFDTAATAAYALKLPLPSNWDGRPVMEIFPAGQAVASSQ